MKTASKYNSNNDLPFFLRNTFDNTLNPDHITRLMGRRNEAPHIVDGYDVTALLDSVAQISN